MATPDQIRRRGRWSLALGTFIAALAAITVASADNTVPDGDGAVPVAANPLAFGNVACGASTNDTALIAINRVGGSANNTFQNGATVTISVLAVTGVGLAASVPVPPGNQISLPTNWVGMANNTLSAGTVTSQVTINSSVAGAGAGTVTYRASGLNVNGANTNRDATMNVTWNTGSCAPADTSAPAITSNVTGTLGANGWYTSDVTVSWSVADPDSAISASSGCGTTVRTTDTTGTTFTCTATSAGGTASRSVTVKRDATAPTISGNASPAPNANGWNNTNVTVSFTCSDATSGIASCPSAQTLSAEGAGQSASGTATDSAGNSASTTVGDIKIDKTAPTASATPSPASNASGWNNTDVTVTFAGSDGISGIDTCTAPAVLTSEGVGQSASGTCTDRAGNVSAPATASGMKIDKTAPAITDLGPTTSPNANGWYAADVLNRFRAEDGLSGLASDCLAAYPASGGDRVQSKTAAGEGASVTVTSDGCTDVAGNTAAGVTSVAFMIDKTAPTISGSAAPAPNANGWNNTDVTVSFTCSDLLSGVGSCQSDATLSTEGAGQAASGTAVDRAGNSSSTTVSGINIDKTAPTATANATPAPNANGWNKTDVTVSFSGTDGLSGIDGCSAPVVLSSEGAGQSASGDCTDKAGNVSALATASGIKIDKTAPTLAWNGGPASGSSHYFGFLPPAPTCTAADSLSGPDTCTVTGYATGVGSHTMTATAKDKAGNTYSEQRSYTVLAWTLVGFFQPVDMDGIFNVVKNGSTVPLKFRVFAGPTELTDVAYVKSLKYGQVPCDANAPNDEIETVATGGTSLRYDTSGGQFVYNWKTPATAGKCYSVTMTTQDGSTLSAYFRLK